MAYRQRDQALYVQLADAMRERITSGELPPGSVLPSETELMNTYGVSRPTARAAFNALRNQGVITVIHGKGAFVRRADLPSHDYRRAITRSPAPVKHGGRRGTKGGPAAQRWAYTDADAARWSVVGEPSQARTEATRALALALVIAEREPVFVYDRVLADRGGRRMTHCLYLPFAVCAEVPALEHDPFRAPEDLYTVLGEKYGELTWTEHVRARMPTPDEVTSLKTPDNAPILITHRITHAHDRRPLALEETRLSADDTQLTYTLTASTQDAEG